jgi:GT2 family glycosyltransferase
MDNKSIDHVAIVVVNYKAADDTLMSVRSLLTQSCSHFHIIVIENGSKDGSFEKFETFQEKHQDKVSILRNNENKGFTGGVNTGIRWAQQQGKYNYVALFNNDAVADKEWLSSLLSKANENASYGIVTGLLLHEDGSTIDSTGEFYSKWGLAFSRDRNQKSAKAHKAGLVFGATGGATLYKMTLLNEVGLFDESFFAYYEDMDISFRSQLRGWEVFYTPKAIAYHKRGATTKKMPGGFAVYQTFKNLPTLFFKNVPKELLLSIGSRFLLAYVMMLGNAIAKGKGGSALAGYFKSIILFWKVALPARKKIQSHKTVSASYLQSIIWQDLPPDQTGLRKLRHIFTGK